MDKMEKDLNWHFSVELYSRKGHHRAEQFLQWQLCVSAKTAAASLARDNRGISILSYRRRRRRRRVQSSLRHAVHLADQRLPPK